MAGLSIVHFIALHCITLQGSVSIQACCLGKSYDKALVQVFTRFAAKRGLIFALTFYAVPCLFNFVKTKLHPAWENLYMYVK